MNHRRNHYIVAVIWIMLGLWLGGGRERPTVLSMGGYVLPGICLIVILRH